ncbi:MAG: lipocalin-like domain-containing protein [Rhodocyclaceae bacterium]|nr:lipocalin-like domain-containing protein [Rhodocyclaceae bacterium]
MTQAAEHLRGAWKLESFEAELQASGQRFKPWGENPNGYFIVEPGGRMIALLTAGERPVGEADGDLASLFRSMVAYTGRYRIEGDRLITKVDASWNEAWNGTEQERFYHFEKDHLVLTTTWAPINFLPGSPVARGILSWVRT